MKKNLLTAALALGVSLSLTACGSEIPEETEVSLQTEAVTETTVYTEMTTVPETEPELLFDQTGDIEETVLFEGSGLKVTALNLSYEEDQAVLTCRLEDTGDRDFYLSWNETSSPILSVNGRYIPVYTESIPVYIGETVEFSMELPYDLLQDYGMNHISEIAFCLTESEFSTGIMKLSTGKAAWSYWETVTEHPDSLSWKVLHTIDQPAYEKEGIRHIGTAIVENIHGATYLALDFENTSDEIRILDMGGETLNGLQLLQEGDMVTLLSGGHAQFMCSLDRINEVNYLEALNIRHVGTLDFKLAQFNSSMKAFSKPEEVHVAVNEAVPLFAGTSRVIAEEEGTSLQLAGMFDGVDEVTLCFVWENRTGGDFFAQVNELSLDGRKLEIMKQPVTLEKDGYGLMAVSVSRDQLEEEDLKDKTFTVQVLEKINGERKTFSYEFKTA